MIKSGFNLAHKATLADEASHMCSICNCQTTGGGIKLGEAAHIKGAKPNSARHDPTQSMEERHSTNNGIWLCANCHTRIDKDEADYSVEHLQEIKKQHLIKAKKNLGLNLKNTGITVDGLHHASSLDGVADEITGIEIKQGATNVKIMPGTQSSASGNAKIITALKIGTD